MKAPRGLPAPGSSTPSHVVTSAGKQPSLCHVPSSAARCVPCPRRRVGRSALSAVAQRPSPGVMTEGVGPPASAHVLGRGQAVVTPGRGYGRPGPGGFLEEVAQSWLQHWPRRPATRTVCPARQRVGPEASSSWAAAPREGVCWRVWARRPRVASSTVS